MTRHQRKTTVTKCKDKQTNESNKQTKKPQSIKKKKKQYNSSYADRRKRNKIINIAFGEMREEITIIKKNGCVFQQRIFREQT